MYQDLLTQLRQIKKILLNENGQLSIFIALIFQVLFVFFAMVINVGLLVHDKINLQNAADIGAFYGAQKQAEIMNEIAHVNYQIRQDYKLLTWRYRVMGTLGRQGLNSPTDSTLPPARRSSASGLSDTAWVNPAYGQEYPSICVANDSWSDMIQDSTQLENYCFSIYGDPKPRIPDLPQIAPFVPGITESAAFTKQAQLAQDASCAKAGPLNWAFTMQMIYAYKLSIAARKEVLWALRTNLIDPNFKDRNNDAVGDGVKKTISKNLTEGNLQGPPQIQVINGLADPNCNKGDGGDFIMPEIRTVITLLYTNAYCNGDRSLFVAGQQDMEQLDPTAVATWDPNSLMKMLGSGEPEQTNPLHSSLGFEKNPWCMGYVGVKVSTATKKPFSPFGGAINLTARAFAQPFGGRIGPWYKERWSRGAVASAEGDRVDPLTSPRLLASGSLDSADKNAQLPNYSRYPGDTLGLTSQLSMGAQNAIVKGFASNPDKTQRLRLKYYAGFDAIPTTGDNLAQGGSPTFPLRLAEISAIQPDLYDAIYYSIDPNYYQAYVANLPDRFNGSLAPVLGQTVAQLPDAGGSLGQNGQPGYNIANQITDSTSGGTDQSVLPNLYYAIRSWQNLLTGWVQNQIQSFDFPQARYAQCVTPASPSIPIPGQCWQGGGRTGYSVRLISKSALTFSGWQVGGDGEAAGSILNPPAADF